MLESRELEGITSEVLLSKMEEQTRKVNHKSDGDKMKKGFYFIGCYQEDKEGKEYFGVDLVEGSYEYYGKLFIHRGMDYKAFYDKWRVSHIDSGSCIVKDINLASARMLAKKMKDFKIWELRTYEELSSAINHPWRYKEEVKAITTMRFDRA